MKSMLSFRKRTFRVLVGVMLFSLVYVWSSAGLCWERNLHADEATIVRWIGKVREHGYVTDRVYPGGWFQLFRLRMFADSLDDALLSRMAQGDSRLALVPPDKPQEPHYRAMQARRFNLLLHSLAVVFLFLCGFECGFGVVASAFGALFFGFHPLPVEFLHYCSTDAALVVSTALAFWLLLRAFRTRSASWSALAAFATGFAISCKYTLTPLALVPFALAVCCTAGKKWTRARRVRIGAAVFAVAFVALGAGFLLGTPALLLNPGFFFADMQVVSRRTYAEVLLPLGDRAGSPIAPILLRIGTFLSESAKAGPAIWLWFLFSLVVSSRRNAPGTRAVVPVLSIAMILYYAFGMPWMRSQETLPLILFLSAVSGAPVEWAFRSFRRMSARRRAVAVLVLFAGLIAFGSDFSRGSRILSAFREPDRRSLCRAWLQACAPKDVSIAVDVYAGRLTTGGLPCSSGGVHRWAEYWEGEPVYAREDGSRNRYDYFVRNTFHIGRDANRSLLFPRRLLPDAARRVAAFESDAPLLLEWRLPDKDVRPTFAQHDMELRALPDTGAGSDLAAVRLFFERPAFVLSDGAPLWTPGVVAPVGPMWAVRVVGRRSSLRIPPPAEAGRSDAQAPTGETWGIVRSTPDAAELRVEWADLFSGSDAKLAPGGAAVAPISACKLFLASRLDLFPVAKVRARGEERGNACRASITCDSAEVIHALRAGGNPAAACQFARALKTLSPDAAAEAFLASVESGSEPDADWRRQAMAVLADCDALFDRIHEADSGLAPFPSGALLRGAPISAHQDFARMRVGKVPAFPGERIPVVLPPGAYRVRFSANPTASDWLLGRKLFVGQVGPVRAGESENAFEADLDVRRDLPLSLDASLPSADPLLSPVLRDVEISWDPLEFLSRSAEELRSALGVSP